MQPNSLQRSFLMSSTQQQLQQFRHLQKKLSDANAVYDRFGRPEQLREIEALEAQMAALPPEIRHMAKREDLLREFPLLVEKYLLERAGRFLDPPPDLIATILNLEQSQDVPTTNEKVKKIIDSLRLLRENEASEDDLHLAILLAENLPESRKVTAPFVLHLKRLAASYLDEWARLMEARNSSAADPEDLGLSTRTWQDDIPDYRANYATWERAHNTTDPEQRVASARFRLVSQIAVLHRLAFTQEAIDKHLFEARNAWVMSRSKT